MSDLTPFHLAIPVHDVTAARKFYVETLGCSVGRSSDKWVDLNLYGHQLVCHEVVDHGGGARGDNPIGNPVDGHDVPVPHFGVVLTMERWRELAARLEHAGINFLIAPYIRFEGEVGEQATMFFSDPSGNAIEFKAFADIDAELFRADG